MLEQQKIHIVVNTITLKNQQSEQDLQNIIETMNPSESPFIYYDSGMINFNYLHNFMSTDLTNMLYFRIFQQNIALKEELKRRDMEEKTYSRQATEPSHQQMPSITKTQSLNSESNDSDHESSDLESDVKEKQLKSERFFGAKKSSKNETKNIPKNFGKAIISFVQNNKELTRRILSNFPQVSLSEFLVYLKSRKRKINSISDLRDLWNGLNNPYSRPIRILSNCFLRKYSLEYIFNSRISNYSGHIKYRTRFLEALKNPSNFTNIKHY